MANVNLPERYLSSMKDILGDEYDAYLESFSMERVYGLRVNTSKISVEDFLKISPFELEPIPWIDNGFYYKGTDKPAKHPYYFAGLYYLQEPSAMTPANRMPVKEGDKILDICAAPGGKTTELGAKLKGTGLLIANDISVSRANALLKNVEVFGLENAIVTTEAPQKLKEHFPEFFDKILIDAPCSGEGMFRKEPAVLKAWEEKEDANGLFAGMQHEILENSYPMLAPGGYIMYSTCTFSPRENEESIRNFLREHPDMHICPILDYERFRHGMNIDKENENPYEYCVRIWPHVMNGEGHFVTLMKKDRPGGEALDEAFGSLKGADVSYRADVEFKDRFQPEKVYRKNDFNCKNSDFLDFMIQSMIPGHFRPERFYESFNRIFYLNGDYGLNLTRLYLGREALLVGQPMKNRFEPSQAFAMSLVPEEYRFVLSLDVDDPRTIKYLKGETIEITDRENQNYIDSCWVLVCVDRYPLGFGKYSSKKPNMLKNKYLPGWRWQ